MGFSPSTKHQTITSLFSIIIDATSGSFTEGIAAASGTFSQVVGVGELLNLPPRTNTQKDAVTTPLAGSMIFNTTSGTVNVFDGTSWKELAFI